MRWIVPILTLAAAVLPAADNLQSALARMDQAAAGFKGLTADMKKDHFVKVIEDHTVDEGSIKVKRAKPKEFRMLVDVTRPDPKKYSIDEKKVQLYLPKQNTVQIYDLSGKNRALAEQFLLLGFGSNSADLTSAYTVQFGGAETVDGQKATRLELTPKSKEILQHVPKIELWISDANGLAVQQKFYEPGGDYTLATFTNMKPAPNLTDADVKLDFPKDVVKQQMK